MTIASCVQAEQEVHRDLCDLALPGLHVHSPLPSPHRPQWADLCRGQPFIVQKSYIDLHLWHHHDISKMLVLT